MQEKEKNKRRWGCWWILLLLAVAGSFPFLWHEGLRWFYDARMYAREDAPLETTGIVFGARVYGNGRLSSMLRDRVETAVQLYHAGQIDTILMSGDHSTPYYNEPDAMADYAISRGVPPSAIQTDYAGLRTYDTCYRAREQFDVDSALLITQKFHLPRALFTCNNLGVSATGVIADMRTYSDRSLAWSENREVPASLVALFDILRRQPATIMGDVPPLILPGG